MPFPGTPDATRLCVKDGFDAARLYELTYTAKDPLVLGIGLVAVLYGLLGYAGFRTARLARDRYAKLLASGLTSLILCQGVMNIFVVLGLVPLTGVPLPFISDAPTYLCVMLAAVTQPDLESCQDRPIGHTLRLRWFPFALGELYPGT